MRSMSQGVSLRLFKALKAQNVTRIADGRAVGSRCPPGTTGGLSELCDTLVIVVSEERGTVSTALHGQLSEIASPTELRAGLEEFYSSRFAAAKRSQWPRQARHLAAGGLSAAIAVASWLVLADHSGTGLRTFAVSIEYGGIPRGLRLPDDAPKEGRVTLVRRGRRVRASHS